MELFSRTSFEKFSNSAAVLKDGKDARQKRQRSEKPQFKKQELGTIIAQKRIADKKYSFGKAEQCLGTAQGSSNRLKYQRPEATNFQLKKFDRLPWPLHLSIKILQ
ncbi:MAG: hypothetical protein LBT62_07150 [Deltaproteobacteria bacterium]|jgi:hypothetical protein|nr:hypothetical protein [Deltaproteobacteria bacterium]